MRKPLLAIAVLMISTIAAGADPTLRVAENDQPSVPPVVITTEPSEPAKPIEAKTPEPTKSVESTKAAAEPAKVVAEPAKTAEPTPAAEAKPAQPQKTKSRVARQESAEQKARRIAAKYGVYW